MNKYVRGAIILTAGILVRSAVRRATKGMGDSTARKLITNGSAVAVSSLLVKYLP